MKFQISSHQMRRPKSKTPCALLPKQRTDAQKVLLNSSSPTLWKDASHLCISCFASPLSVTHSETELEISHLSLTVPLSIGSQPGQRMLCSLLQRSSLVRSKWTLISEKRAVIWCKCSIRTPKVPRRNSCRNSRDTTTLHQPLTWSLSLHSRVF